MTTTNWLFVIAISIPAGVACLGLGNWGAALLAPPRAKVSLASEANSKFGGVDSLYSATEYAQTAQVGDNQAVIKVDAEKEFNSAFGGANLGVTFAKFQENPKVLQERLPQADQILALKKKLENPAKDFQVEPIPQAKLSEFIQPKPKEPFKISEQGNELAFVWVDKGFWCCVDESPSKPPAEFYLIKDDVKLKHRPSSPDKDQWLAACANPEIKQLNKEPFGKGEYLADGKVIGPSKLAPDPKWNDPWDPAKRIDETLAKVVVAPPAPSAVNLRANKLAKENGERAMDAKASGRYVPLAIKQLTEEDRAAAAQNAEKETFAYRIVIAP